MSDLVAPTPLFEASLCVWPDGRATLVGSKLEVTTPETLDLITQALCDALTEWMRQTVGRGPNAILGDGGAAVVATRARLYAVLAELEALRPSSPAPSPR